MKYSFLDSNSWPLFPRNSPQAVCSRPRSLQFEPESMSFLSVQWYHLTQQSQATTPGNIHTIKHPPSTSHQKILWPTPRLFLVITVDSVDILWCTVPRYKKTNNITNYCLQYTHPLFKNNIKQQFFQLWVLAPDFGLVCYVRPDTTDGMFCVDSMDVLYHFASNMIIHDLITMLGFAMSYISVFKMEHGKQTVS